MNEMDNKYIEEIFQYKKRARKPAWIKWGAMAACLCLLVGGAVMYQSLNAPSRPGAGPGVQTGGSVSETVDPIISSLAVYPAASLIDYFRGECLIVINKAPTPRDRSADLLIKEPIGQVFSQIKVKGE